MSARLRSRLRSFDRALRLPGRLWTQVLPDWDELFDEDEDYFVLIDKHNDSQSRGIGEPRSPRFPFLLPTLTHLPTLAVEAIPEFEPMAWCEECDDTGIVDDYEWMANPYNNPYFNGPVPQQDCPNCT